MRRISPARSCLLSFSAHNPRVAASVIRTCGTLEGSLVVSWPLWGFAWVLQWVLTKCRTPCSRSRSLGGSAPCSIFSNLVLSCVWFPLCGYGALLCPSKTGRRRSRHQLDLFEHRVCFRIGPSSVSNLTSAREEGGSVHSFMFFSSRTALIFFVFVDFQKAFDTAWVEGTLVMRW